MRSESKTHLEEASLLPTGTHRTKEAKFECLNTFGRISRSCKPRTEAVSSGNRARDADIVVVSLRKHCRQELWWVLPSRAASRKRVPSP